MRPDYFRQYLVQVRQELAARLVERLYADGTGKPSKWWLGFQKRSNCNLSFTQSQFSNASRHRVHEQKSRDISIMADEYRVQVQCESCLKESCFPFPFVRVLSAIPNGGHVPTDSLSAFAARSRTEHCRSPIRIHPTPHQRSTFTTPCKRAVQHLSFFSVSFVI